MFLEKLKESFDKNVIQQPIKLPEESYPSMLRNMIAFCLDSLFLGAIRMVIILISSLFINSYRVEFIDKFNGLFGNISHFDITMRFHRYIFFTSTFGKGIIIVIFLCILAGIIYHSYMLQTKWCATFGRRIISIYIVKNNNEKLTAIQSIIRTILNYIPWFLPFLAYYTWFDHRYISIVCILLSCFWSDTYVFSGKRIGIQDIIMKTSPRIGKK